MQWLTCCFGYLFGKKKNEGCGCESRLQTSCLESLPVFLFMCVRACVCALVPGCAAPKSAWISVDVQFASPAQNDSPREFRLQHPSLKVGGQTYASEHQKSNYVGLPRARISTLTFDAYSGSPKIRTFTSALCFLFSSLFSRMQEVASNECWW